MRSFLFVHRTIFFWLFYATISNILSACCCLIIAKIIFCRMFIVFAVVCWYGATYKRHCILLAAAYLTYIQFYWCELNAIFWKIIYLNRNICNAVNFEPLSIQIYLYYCYTSFYIKFKLHHLFVLTISKNAIYDYG